MSGPKSCRLLPARRQPRPSPLRNALSFRAVRSTWRPLPCRPHERRRPWSALAFRKEHYSVTTALTAGRARWSTSLIAPALACAVGAGYEACFPVNKPNVRITPWNRCAHTCGPPTARTRANGVILGTPRRAPAPTVDKITRLRAQGKSLQAIADELNRLRIPTARGGAKWRSSSVASVLARVS